MSLTDLEFRSNMRLMLRLLLSVVTIFTALVVSSGCTSNRLSTAGETPPAISNGSISGYVYESDGKTPIAGVNIQVWAAEPGNFWRAVGTPVTDANGKYTIGGLGNGSYNLMASATGYRLQETPDGIACSVVSGETTSVNFEMQKLCSISGRVFDESNGKAIANAIVCASVNYVVDGCLTATTAADGSYKITDLYPGGGAILEVMADGYVPRYYDGVYEWRDAATVTPRFGENTPDIDIGLEKGGSISGRVYQPDGTTPAANVLVYWDGFSSGPSVSTDGEGNYSIGGLLTGDYLLMTGADQGASYSSRLVSVKIGQPTPGADLKLIVCGSVSGYVYELDTTSSSRYERKVTPVGGGEALVHVSLDTSECYDCYEHQTQTNQDGSYSIEKLPPGQYAVNVLVFRGGPVELLKPYTVKITSGKNTILDLIIFGTY